MNKSKQELDQTKRLQTIIKDVMSNLSNEIESSDEMGKALRAKINKIQIKFFQHLKKQCKVELQWIRKNYSMMERKEDDESNKKLQSHLLEWESCLLKNDLGVEKFFSNIKYDHFSIFQSQDSCMQSCASEMTGLSDEGLRNCFTGCFNGMIRDMKSSYLKIESKIDEIESLI